MVLVAPDPDHNFCCKYVICCIYKIMISAFCDARSPYGRSLSPIMVPIKHQLHFLFIPCQINETRVTALGVHFSRSHGQTVQACH